MKRVNPCNPPACYMNTIKQWLFSPERLESRVVGSKFVRNHVLRSFVDPLAQGYFGAPPDATSSQHAMFVLRRFTCDVIYFGLDSLIISTCRHETQPR